MKITLVYFALVSLFTNHVSADRFIPDYLRKENQLNHMRKKCGLCAQDTHEHGTSEKEPKITNDICAESDP